MSPKFPTLQGDKALGDGAETGLCPPVLALAIVELLRQNVEPEKKPQPSGGGGQAGGGGRQAGKAK